MATVSELVVLVTANTAQFQSGMARAEASTSRFAAAAKVGLAIAAVAAVKFVADSVEAYNEHQEALIELQTTIDNSPQLIGASTKAFEDQATALAELTGFQDEEILKADAVLGRFGLTASQLREVNPLVLDYARATGQDAATAAGSLGKALLGNSRALKAIGINFTATGDTAKDFNDIVDLMQGKVGGLAEAYGKTLPGQLDIAAQKFSDIKETVGKAVVPILTKLLDLAKPLIGVLKLVADHVDLVVTAGLAFAAWKFIPPLLQGIASGLTSIGFTSAATSVLSFSAALSGAVPPASSFATVFATLTAALAAWDPLQLVDDTKKLRESMEVNTKAFGESNVILGRVAVSSNLVGEDFAKTADKTETLATEQAKLAGKLDAVTANMEEQKAAAQQLAGGMLGLVSSAKDLAEKQDVVNRLQEKGHDSGKKYNDAVLDLLVSQEDFNDQLRDYRDQLDLAGMNTDDAEGKVVKLGKSLGLTKQDVLAILNPLDQYKNKLDAIPSEVSTDIISRFIQIGNINPGGPSPRLQHGGVVDRTGLAVVHKGEVFSGVNNEMGFGAGINGDIVLQIDGQTFARITRDQLNKLADRNVTAGVR